METGVIDDAVIAPSEQQRSDLWKILHSVTEGNVREGIGLTHDIAVLIYRIPDFISAAEKTLAAPFPEASPVVVGHMGAATSTTSPCSFTRSGRDCKRRRS